MIPLDSTGSKTKVCEKTANNSFTVTEL